LGGSAVKYPLRAPEKRQDIRRSSWQPDRETAIQEVIKHFEIKDPEQRRRLIAQRSD
jgi:hypothetical protein